MEISKAAPCDSATRTIVSSVVILRIAFESTSNSDWTIRKPVLSENSSRSAKERQTNQPSHEASDQGTGIDPTPAVNAFVETTANPKAPTMLTSALAASGITETLPRVRATVGLFRLGTAVAGVKDPMITAAPAATSTKF